MAKIGRRNILSVVRLATPGAYLDGRARGEILMPGRYVPKGTLAGESFDVFVFRDSEDRLVATPETPRVMVGEFAALRVVSSDPHIGAFLDWGLAKDLFLPRREQTRAVAAGDWVVVYVFVDLKTDRVVATTRLGRHLNVAPPAYEENQAVELLVYGRTPLGYTAIVNSAHTGLLYHSEAPDALEVGSRLMAYVRAVRADGKIDLSVHPAGPAKVAPLKEQILEALRSAGGRLPYGDATPPEKIRATFGSSKKAFKAAIGSLYRERLIVIAGGEISLAGRR